MNNEKPLVSVIIPTYNTPYDFLFESIRSILCQADILLELIVVDDGTDLIDDLNKIKTFFCNEKRVSFVNNYHKKGVAGALNTGIDLAKGKYLLRMDADDVSNIDRIKKQVAFMEKHPEVSLFSSSAKCFGSSKRTFKVPTNDIAIKVGLLFKNTIVHPTVCLRKSSIDSYNLRYNEDVQNEDYDLWMRMSLIKGFYFSATKKTLLKYRIHQKQVTNERKHILDTQGLSLRMKYLLTICKNIENNLALIFAKFTMGDKIASGKELFDVQKIVYQLAKDNEVFYKKNNMRKAYWKYCFRRTLSSCVHNHSFHPIVLIRCLLRAF